MHLHEIFRLDSHDEFPDNYLHYFNNVTSQHQMPAHANNLATSNHWIFKTSQIGDDIHMGSFEGDRIISYASMHKWLDGYQIDFTATEHEFRSQGLIRYAIEYAVKNWAPIYSDTRQTPEAEAVWRALITRPNIVKYQYYNILTRVIKNLKITNGKITPNPWNDKEDTVVRATLIPIKEDLQQLKESRDQWDVERKRRNPWLGKYFVNYAP